MHAHTWWVQKEALPNSLAFAAAQRTTMLDNGEVAPYVLEVLDDMGLVQTTPKGDRGRPVSVLHTVMQQRGLAVADTATWHTKQKLPDSAPLHVVSLSHAASSDVATWVNTLWSISQKAMAGSSRVEEELIKYAVPHPQALCATN